VAVQAQKTLLKIVHQSASVGSSLAVLQTQLSVPARPACPEMQPVINYQMVVGVPANAATSAPQDQQPWRLVLLVPRAPAALQ